MGEGNIVVFKGTVDGIVVILDEQAPFEEVISYFKQKLNESKAFFKGSKVGIRFKGRLLSSDEQEVLIDILRRQNIINISFVHPFENEPIPYDEKMLWVKNELDTMNGSLTHFYYGIIRSGIEVEYPGNVVVFGDINPGGVVKAGGNVIVFGIVKGKIHAGLDANFKAPFIISKGMTPIQIGLKNVIAPCSKEEKISLEEFQIAYLDNEQIYIDVLDQKSINHMLLANENQGV
ncbi:MAG: hypothetical protein E7231_06350 [Cellulosilyticum sp.]|nr:hypothetical protein [Cellulosilyticum sp.]